MAKFPPQLRQGRDTMGVLQNASGHLFYVTPLSYQQRNTTGPAKDILRQTAYRISLAYVSYYIIGCCRTNLGNLTTASNVDVLKHHMMTEG